MIFQKLYGSKGGVTITFLLLISVILCNPVQAQSTFTLSELTFDTLVRTGSDMVLLTDDHYHDSSELADEINQFNQLVPELVDLEVIGQSFLGKDIISLKITNELSSPSEYARKVYQQFGFKFYETYHNMGLKLI